MKYVSIFLFITFLMTGAALASSGSVDLGATIGSSGSSGTVTSVGLTMPSIFSVSGSPVTTTGTLAVTLGTEAANLVFAGPTTGAAATPTFRSLVAADIPSLSGVYLPLTGGTLSGALAIGLASTTALTVNTTSFVVDSTNNGVGIGVAPSTAAIIDAVNSTGATKTVQLTGYGTGSAIGERGRFARGTSGSPTATQSGDTLHFFSGRGYGATGFASASTGLMNITAAENFTDSAMGTYLSFMTTPIGSVTSAETMRLNTDGRLALGATLASPGANLDIRSGTITTNVPALNITQTWNNSGTTFDAPFQMGITDTASNAASLLADFKVGGNSKLTFSKTGTVTGGDVAGGTNTYAIGQSSSTTFIQANGGLMDLYGNGTNRALQLDVVSLVPRISVPGIIAFETAANGTRDTILSRKGAANLQFGNADAAAPVAQTLSAQSVVAGTSNTAGQNLTIQGSAGTGTGNGGSILIQTAPAGSTGTAQNALVTALTINQAGHLISGGTAQSGGNLATFGTSPSIAGNDTAGRITIGSGGATAGVLTFVKAWGTAPVCFAQDETTSITIRATATTTTLTFTGAMVAADLVTYNCIGY